MSQSGRLKVTEIFHSIQGEGVRAGVRCAFVRLTGCPLRCTYCDTEYAFEGGRWMTQDEIVAQVEGFGCPTVEITGGEPLSQPDVLPLMTRLADLGKLVLLETSGALPIDRVDPRVVRIVDFKTPSSGEVERNCWANIDQLRPGDEVKFVIGTRADYEWSRDVVRRHDLTRRCPVIFCPVVGLADEQRGGLKLYQGHLEPARLAEWIVADRLDVRFGYQLHKIIWSPTARGV
ncbi:MAG: radical SAM protein [Planctomycetes bacterium]|nr:radical SAM protein [Planctomycetota bacterium]